MRRLKVIAITLLCLTLYNNLFAQPGIISLNSSGVYIWKVKEQSAVDDLTDKMESPGYDVSNWTNAIVPGTVFASYVAARLEKDPNFGDNIQQVDKAKYDRNFWYRLQFKSPDNYDKGITWLNFRGINRKADIYLNGKMIGSLDGFMQRGQFDISKLLNRQGNNVLAVLVYYPRGPLGNAASPSYISSAGWDWMPYVPGLNSGITDNVYLSNSGDLTIRDPWIKAGLPTNARADLSIDLEVSNNTGKPAQGIVKGIIQPGDIAFSQKVFVGANSIEPVKIDYKRFQQLVINNPRLWWPNGYGDPNLYTCKLTLTVGDQVSDTKEVQFGIKKYSYDTIGNVLHVSINGTKVFLKGGNWGMSEYMLRCRGSEYDTKVRLHKEMNFNIIRNWIGSTTDEEFYDACDKYGIMIWDDFWLNANPNLPRDLNVFNANVIEKLKRFRNHPAIAVWCADNEGWPEPPLGGWLKENIKTFDNGDRYYQANSHADNLTGSGPWAGLDPRSYFYDAPLAIGGNRGWGLRSEIGTAVFVNFESFKKFMPKDKWWPRNDMWNLHYFGPLAFNAGPDPYEESITTRYGQPKGIEDFCRKSQFLNLETNKAMYEGWLDHIWEDASGIMTWMSQSAYPSMVWQTYDYYYDLTGAFWGARKACEPLHIQWNPANNSVKIINTSRYDATALTAEASVYNLDGKLVQRYNASVQTDVPSNSAVHCFDMMFNRKNINLALNKPVFASSTTFGTPELVADNNNTTRWASRSGDNEWIYVDLGSVKEVNGVGLNWEDAYAKSFRIQVSDDAKAWKDVYMSTDGKPGEQKIYFAELPARYVRMLGIERGSYWGYSLYDFEVYEGNVKTEDLTGVHFIKLKLKDNAGKLVSDNFYWRGNRRKDFTALNSLPGVQLKITKKITHLDGRCYINAQITNPASSPGIAFGIRVQAILPSTGDQILPAIMNDNYFTLFKGESKDIRIEFNEALIKDGVVPDVIAVPYNDLKK